MSASFRFPLALGLLLALPVSLAGQVLNNTGGSLFIGSGAELYTPDNVNNSGINAAADITIAGDGQLTVDGDGRQVINNSTLQNDGLLRLETADFINGAGAAYSGGGTVQFASGNPTTDVALLEMNGDAIDTLILDGPAVQQDGDPDNLRITGALRLNLGVLDPGVSNTIVYQGDPAELQSATGFAGPNTFSYVAGRFQQSGTGNLFYPIGVNQVPSSRVDWRPIQLWGVQGSSPSIAAIAATGVGLATGLGVGTVNTTRSWNLQLAGGTYNGADSVSIPVSSLDNLVSANPSAGELQTYVVAQAPASSRYTSLGGNFSQMLPDSIITSDSLLGPGLGTFTLGRCQYLPPDTLLADQDSICLGDSAFVEALNLDPEADEYQWQVSLNGAGGPYTNIGPAMTLSAADTLDLLDTLSQSSTFQVITSRTGPDACEQVASSTSDDTARIDVIPGLRLDVSAFLEGPYDPATNSMSLANLRSIPGLNNDLVERYGPGGTAGDTVMSTGTSVPANAVDVVALELWNDGPDPDALPDMMADSTFGWLLSDGSVVRFKDGGTGPVVDPNFCDTTGGQHFVVVRHRNHLPIVTASTLNFSSGMAASRIRPSHTAFRAEYARVARPAPAGRG